MEGETGESSRKKERPAIRTGGWYVFLDSSAISSLNLREGHPPMSSGCSPPVTYYVAFKRKKTFRLIRQFELQIHSIGRLTAVFTMKTSWRERYKQADLEGAALHQVYRQAEVYLITMSVGEASGVRNKINNACCYGTHTMYSCIKSGIQHSVGRDETKEVFQCCSDYPIEGKLLFR